MSIKRLCRAKILFLTAVFGVASSAVVNATAGVPYSEDGKNSDSSIFRKLRNNRHFFQNDGDLKKLDESKKSQSVNWLKVSSAVAGLTAGGVITVAGVSYNLSKKEDKQSFFQWIYSAFNNGEISKKEVDDIVEKLNEIKDKEGISGSELEEKTKTDGDKSQEERKQEEEERRQKEEEERKQKEEEEKRQKEEEERKQKEEEERRQKEEEERKQKEEGKSEERRVEVDSDSVELFFRLRSKIVRHIPTFANRIRELELSKRAGKDVGFLDRWIYCIDDEGLPFFSKEKSYNMIGVIFFILWLFNIILSWPVLGKLLQPKNKTIKKVEKEGGDAPSKFSKAASFLSAAVGLAVNDAVGVLIPLYTPVSCIWKTVFIAKKVKNGLKKKRKMKKTDQKERMDDEKIIGDNGEYTKNALV